MKDTEELLKDLEGYSKTGQYKKPEKKVKEIKKEKNMENPERKEVVLRFRMPGMPSPRAIERIIYILVILALLYFAFVKPINKECFSMPSFGFFGGEKNVNVTTTEAVAEEVEEEEEVVDENLTGNVEPERPVIEELVPTSELTASDFDFTIGYLTKDKETNTTVKIKDIKFTIRNKGTVSFTGFVEAYMYDEATKEAMKDFKRGEKVVAVNADSSLTYSIAISPSTFRDLKQEKTIVLLLRDNKRELLKKATKTVNFSQ